MPPSIYPWFKNPLVYIKVVKSGNFKLLLFQRISPASISPSAWRNSQNFSGNIRLLVLNFTEHHECGSAERAGTHLNKKIIRFPTVIRNVTVYGSRILEYQFQHLNRSGTSINSIFESLLWHYTCKIWTVSIYVYLPVLSLISEVNKSFM